MLAFLLAFLHIFCGRGMQKWPLNSTIAVADAKEAVQRDQAFPWQFTVRGHLNITRSCIVILSGRALQVCRYLYIHSNILAVTDEICKTQIHGCAIAKHGLQFPGLHSASPQKSKQVQSTRFFYWRLMKKRCARIRI